MIQGWNEAQIALRTQYARFAAAHIAPNAPVCDAENRFDFGTWELLTAEGFWGLLLPSSRPEAAEGGRSGERRKPSRKQIWNPDSTLGATPDSTLGTTPDSTPWWNLAAAIEGLASESNDAGFPLTVIAQVAFLRGLLRHGTPEQQASLLPRIREGMLTATAVAEPQSGTNVYGLRTTAHKVEGGYLLNGEKWNISHANTAGVAAILAQVEGQAKPTLFLVDTATPGYTAGPNDDKLGNRTIPTGWIKLEEVFVPTASLLGKENEGLAPLIDIGWTARALYGLAAAAFPTPVLRDVMQWVRERRSFKSSLADLQYVQGRLTDVRMGMETARWMALGALHELISGSPRAGLACSTAKIHGCAAYRRAAEQLMALTGSMGYQRGDVARMLRDAMGWMSVGGTEEMHRINIWGRMLEE